MRDSFDFKVCQEGGVTLFRPMTPSANTFNTPPLPEERIKLAVKNIWKLEARRFGS